VQAAQARPAIQRRVAALRDREASARAAVRNAAASVEESMLQLATRVNIAEHSAAADMAEDMDTFLAAVIEELRSWDVYLERLQVKVATTAGSGREQAEGAIGVLRRYRNVLGAHVGEVASSSGEAWREVREDVRATRDELESRAAKLEAGLGERGDHVHNGPRQRGASAPRTWAGRP
jgi:hypothetical protein